MGRGKKKWGPRPPDSSEEDDDGAHKRSIKERLEAPDSSDEIMRNKHSWLHWQPHRKLHNEHQHNVREGRKLLSHLSRPMLGQDPGQAA